MSRGVRLGFAALIALVLATVLALAAPTVSLTSGASPSSSAEARTFGGTPLDDVLHWADANKKCGLTQNQLAALMIPPTYPETGAPSTQAPSPMTLSRYDNQAALYAFGNSSTPNRNAFWHPGIGMFAFDEAGGWGMTASERIDTWSSSAKAAEVMANRWCANPSLSYVWAPWFGCANNRCLAIYNEIYQSGNLVNLSRDLGVSRTGGMEYRVCRLGDSTTVNCWFVDPSKAQGYKGFANPAFGPSPISAPFYVYSRNGHEYRHWLAADSGYNADITAHKPLAANSRNGLSWSTSDRLCDETTHRGTCLPGQPAAHDPFGSVDIITGGDGNVRVAGWAIDWDTTGPVEMHVYVDGVGTGGIMADKERSDVGDVYPVYGDFHGFDATVPAAPGARDVCVFAINQQAGTNILLSCRRVLIGGSPFGSVEVIEGGLSSVHVRGWAIDPDTTAPIEMHVYVDGVGTSGIMANRTRGDVGAHYPDYGTEHGFDATLPAAAGTHQVCVFGIDQGHGANTLLRCQDVIVPSGPPFGSVDRIQGVPGGVNVRGWIIDPDTVGPAELHVYIDGVGTSGIMANQSRPDVGAQYPVYGNNHGFDTLLGASPGSHQVCIFAINQGAGANLLMQCRTVQVPGGSPFGSVDVVSRTGGGIRVAGWAIDPDTTAPVEMHVYIDGVGTSGILANLSRPDVASVYPVYGNNHGFEVVLAASGAPHDVCVFAIDQGLGSNLLMHCQRV
jgi:hypothetical protein